MFVMHLLLTRFASRLRRFWNCTEAATSVEYAVMLMLIAGICITVIQGMGGSAAFLWDASVTDLNNAVTSN